MQILKDIVSTIKTDSRVKEVRRGLYWTAVDSHRCGMASAMAFGKSCAGNQAEAKTVPLTDLTALVLADRCFSDNLSEASLGMAAINSLIDFDPDNCTDLEGVSHICGISEGKNVSVIGHFPNLEDLGRVAKNLWIIEKNPGPGDHPEDKSAELLPMSDIVVISSTTLVNHTLDGILDMCGKKNIKMLLGPSTPMTDVLFDYGIDYLSGSVVTDTGLLMKLVSEGGNFRQIKRSGAVRTLTMAREGSSGS